MSVKSERITILGTPEFKAYLIQAAEQEGTSISELVRRRCENPAPTLEENTLRELIQTVSESTDRAKKSLEKGLADANQVLAELRRKH